MVTTYRCTAMLYPNKKEELHMLSFTDVMVTVFCLLTLWLAKAIVEEMGNSIGQAISRFFIERQKHNNNVEAKTKFRVSKTRQRQIHIGGPAEESVNISTDAETTLGEIRVVIDGDDRQALLIRRDP